MVIKRGDIYYADLSPVVGAEEGGTRLVVVISNDEINRYTSTVVVAAITSKKIKLNSSRVKFSGENIGLVKDYVILLEQIRTLDKIRIKEKMGHIDDEKMKEVDQALQVSLNLQNA